MNSSTVLMALMMVPTMPHGSTSTFQPLAWMSTSRKIDSPKVVPESRARAVNTHKP
jgi:hypothetical protein